MSGEGRVHGAESIGHGVWAEGTSMSSIKSNSAIIVKTVNKKTKIYSGEKSNC
jgi:hypothetical protein